MRILCEIYPDTMIMLMKEDIQNGITLEILMTKKHKKTPEEKAAVNINMQKKVGCYIFLHIKRNCEIFIFKCAKIMKIVRIHILIQKNFHVIRLKNEA